MGWYSAWIWWCKAEGQYQRNFDWAWWTRHIAVCRKQKWRSRCYGKIKGIWNWPFLLYPEISWNAKSVSLEKISKNLNIHKDTLLFIDDQAFEREEVQNAHPEISCWDAVRYKDLIVDPLLKPAFVTEDAKDAGRCIWRMIAEKRTKSSLKDRPNNFLPLWIWSLRSAMRKKATCAGRRAYGAYKPAECKRKNIRLSGIKLFPKVRFSYVASLRAWGQVRLLWKDRTLFNRRKGRWMAY